MKGERLKESRRGVSIKQSGCLWLCGEGSSRRRRAGFKESSLSEVAHDEGHRHQGDADAGRGEELVDGVGQDEGARPCRHLGADDGFAEAHLAEHGRHVDPAGERGDS